MLHRAKNLDPAQPTRSQRRSRQGEPAATATLADDENRRLASRTGVRMEEAHMPHPNFTAQRGCISEPLS
jgi:hypothetical protein